MTAAPEKSQEILISVIIPTYNYADFLPRALESVIPQLTERHELIIVDDGSTDHTPTVVAALAQQYPERFRYISKKNGGAASARNYGIQHSNGKFLLFLDADDELAPQALSNIVEHLNTHPETEVLIGGHESIYPNGKRRKHLAKPLAATGEKRLNDYLLKKRIPICHGATLFHRKVFTRGLYPENFKSSEDIPVFAQALANFSCNVLFSNLALIHKHDDSLRHRFTPSLPEGLALVDEIFAPERLGEEFQRLKKRYFIQRNLSLFRSAYIAGEKTAAKKYFTNALKKNPRVLLRWSYTKKALRLYLNLDRSSGEE